jgi:DNA polymerase
VKTRWSCGALSLAGKEAKVAARYDILRELGLLPLWRLRSVPAEVAETRNACTSSAAEAPARYNAAAPGQSREPPVDRLQHIAALKWPEFATDVAACTACGLCRTRNKAVPGVGDVHAQWLFVGEAPGAEEDARGEPFVGQAGRLLDNMLVALGMKRGANVYIANVLKCRPPGNRTPSPLEVESCRPYLDRQIALIRPTLIVALGKSAATTLLNVDATIASLRGRVHRYQGVPLIVTYHPAYLLRNLPDKAKAWEDLCLARATLRRLLAASDGSAGLQTAASAPN